MVKKVFAISQQTIKLKIHEEADLFSVYDPEQKMISEDVLAFISRSFEKVRRNSRDEYILHIESDTPVKQESVKQRIKECFCEEKDMVKKEMRRHFLKAACLGVFGIVVLAIWYYLSLDSENVNLEVFSIIGWVAIWEAASILIMQMYDLNRIRRTFGKLSEAKIIISEHAGV